MSSSHPAGSPEPNGAAYPAPAPPLRPSHRMKLRNGTFIVPSTGERSRRHLTLRSSLWRNPNTGPLGGRSSSSSSSSSSSDNPDMFAPNSTLAERASAAALGIYNGAARLGRWLDSPVGRGVLKCTLSYTLASLFTFWPPLSDFLGRPDGKHMVATITTYFHPARSAGSMIEAVLISIVAVAYAQLMSILSMCVSVLFGGVWGMVATAHALVVILFIGGGFGFIGWVKQRLNNPLVNVGSTLASLAIISVVTKETAVLTNVFSNQKIVQISKMLVVAVLITTAVNLLVWRQSAVRLLPQVITKASVSLGDMLAMITKGFLSGVEDDLLSPEFQAGSAAYASLYPKLAKNLRESKFERYLLGREELYQLDRAVVKSMEALAQSIGGLRSAANTQFALLKESPEPPMLGNLTPDILSPTTVLSPLSARTVPKSAKDRQPALTAIDELSEESADDGRRRVSSGATTPTIDLLALRAASFRTRSDIFEMFIALQGPSMKSLAYTLAEILRAPPFGSGPDFDVTLNDHFRQSLTDALALYNTARAEALHKLYKLIELGQSRSEKLQADFEEVAAACGHFSFSLQSFGEEMQKYLDVLEDLKYANEHKTRSWNWIKWWRQGRHKYLVLPFHPEERESMIKPIKKTALPRGVADTMVKRRDTYNWEVAPNASRMLSELSKLILGLAREISRDDIRFGLKVGVGAALWAMFAFIPQTRDTYQNWRGEWGLLSFMIVCSMTVGASNTTGWSRFLGTVIGLTASVANWNVARGNAVGLVFLGWLVAFWSFWMIVARGNAPLGRITLLAYNVTTLYAYTLSRRVDDNDDDEGGVHPLIMEIARHRFIAVTAGVVWGLIVCRLVWPISARKKFKEGLSMLYLQMGLVWKRGPLGMLLRSDCTRSYLKPGEQGALRKYADRLNSLRTSAASEFELRGPFPVRQSARLMACTTRLLDAFYAMSLVTQRKGRLTGGERALLLFTAQERSTLCDRICHVFQVLASSMMLEYPLTEAIPSVDSVRDRLLGKIFQFRKEHARRVAEANAEAGARPGSSSTMGSSNSDRGGGGGASGGGGGSIGSIGEFMEGATLPHVVVEERDYALLYAYALVTGQVADELKAVAREVEGLYGVLDKEVLLLQ